MILELGDALRASSLRLARIGRVQSVIEESPGTRDILARFIAGDSTQSALGAARDLMETGRAVTVSLPRAGRRLARPQRRHRGRVRTARRRGRLPGARR